MRTLISFCAPFARWPRALTTPTSTIQLQGPGTTSRDVHLRLSPGVTEPRRCLKSGYVAVTVVVNRDMIIIGC